MKQEEWKDLRLPGMFLTPHQMVQGGLEWGRCTEKPIFLQEEARAQGILATIARLGPLTGGIGFVAAEAAISSLNFCKMATSCITQKRLWLKKDIKRSK